MNLLGQGASEGALGHPELGGEGWQEEQQIWDLCLCMPEAPAGDFPVG